MLRSLGVGYIPAKGCGLTVIDDGGVFGGDVSNEGPFGVAGMFDWVEQGLCDAVLFMVVQGGK